MLEVTGKGDNARPVQPDAVAFAPMSLHSRSISLLPFGALTCLLSLIAGCMSVPQPQENRPEAIAVTAPAPAPVIPAASAAATDTTAAASIETPLIKASVGEEIALRAIALVGKPYRYGGADLDGFDCSGLVFFIHQALGYTVPRTAAQQQQAALRIKKAELQPGDLLFFKTTRSKRVSHVGVYVGDNRFVHAPQSGKLIELRTLDDQYYGPRLVSSGRLHPVS